MRTALIGFGALLGYLGFVFVMTVLVNYLFFPPVPLIQLLGVSVLFSILAGVMYPICWIAGDIIRTFRE